MDFFYPDPLNPRKDFPKEDLRLLGDSLKKKQLMRLISRESGMLADASGAGGEARGPQDARRKQEVKTRDFDEQDAA